MMRKDPTLLPATTLAPGPGAYLDDLLGSRFLPKQWARRIWSAEDLPSHLQRRVARLPLDSEWRAYSDEERIFFAIARIHAPASVRDSVRALDVYFLDRNGAVYSAAVWANDSKQGWWLDEVLEASYDCEHGWWFDALIDPQPVDEEAVPQHVPQCVAHHASQPVAQRVSQPSLSCPPLGKVVAALRAPRARGRKSVL